MGSGSKPAALKMMLPDRGRQVERLAAVIDQVGDIVASEASQTRLSERLARLAEPLAREGEELSSDLCHQLGDPLPFDVAGRGSRQGSEVPGTS